MIDPQWFEGVCDLADAELAHLRLDGIEPDRLSELLGEVNEVLPFLLGRGGGFADWPLARAALRRSIATFPRPRDARPAEAAPAPGASSGRGELYDGLRRTLVASDIHWHPDWEERGVHVEEVIDAMRRVRMAERRGDDSPGMFIARV